MDIRESEVILRNINYFKSPSCMEKWKTYFEKSKMGFEKQIAGFVWP